VASIVCTLASDNDTGTTNASQEVVSSTVGLGKAALGRPSAITNSSWLAGPVDKSIEVTFAACGTGLGSRMTEHQKIDMSQFVVAWFSWVNRVSSYHV